MWEIDLEEVRTLRDSDLSRVGHSDSDKVTVWDTIRVETRFKDYENSGKEHELTFSKNNIPL